MHFAADFYVLLQTMLPLSSAGKPVFMQVRTPVGVRLKYIKVLNTCVHTGADFCRSTAQVHQDT